MRRKPRRTRKSGARFMRWLYLIVFCGFGWVLFLGDYGALKIISAHRSEAEIRGEIVELKVRKEVLLVRCERLKGDPLLVETLAREKLGMVKPGEKCYRLVD